MTGRRGRVVQGEIEGLVVARLGGLSYETADEEDLADLASIFVGTLVEFPDLLLRLAVEVGALKPLDRTHCNYHRGFCHNPLDCDDYPTFYTTLKASESAPPQEEGQ